MLMVMIPVEAVITAWLYDLLLESLRSRWGTHTASLRAPSDGGGGGSGTGSSAGSGADPVIKSAGRSRSARVGCSVVLWEISALFVNKMSKQWQQLKRILKCRIINALFPALLLSWPVPYRSMQLNTQLATPPPSHARWLRVRSLRRTVCLFKQKTEAGCTCSHNGPSI